MRHRRLLLSALLATALVRPGAAEALSIRTNVSVTALADGGESFLVLVNRDGPEGGGSTAYRIVDARRGASASFQVSSDFSPGDGSTPQRVTVGSCKEAAARLKKLLAKKKISGVTVQPDKCAGKWRAGVVKVSDAARKKVQASAFKHKKGVHGLANGGLVLGKVGKTIGQWPRTSAPAAVTTDGVSPAYRTPHGKAVVTLASGHHSTWLGPVWYSSTGKAGSHKKVTFSAGGKR